MSFTTAKPSPYALIPGRTRRRGHRPGWVSEHPAVLGLPVVERRGHAVHGQGQRRPVLALQVVREHPGGLRLLLQPVVAQGVVHLAGPGEGQQPHPGEPGGGGDRGGLQQTRAVGAAADRVGRHGHHDRELLLGVLVAPGRELVADGRLVAVSDRSVLHGPVGREADLHQPARPREGLVEAVPREGRTQVAVDRTPGGGDWLSVLRGKRLRDCRTRRLHVPGRLLALVGPGGPPPFGRTRPFRTTTRQHNHPCRHRQGNRPALRAFGRPDQAVRSSGGV